MAEEDADRDSSEKIQLVSAFFLFRGYFSSLLLDLFVFLSFSSLLVPYRSLKILVGRLLLRWLEPEL